MSDPWDPNSEIYAQSLRDYEALMEIDYDRSLDRLRSEHVVNPLRPGESGLESEAVSLLEARGFRPVVRTHSTTRSGDEAETESWVDPTGTTKVEIARAPASVRDLHFISTYFADGTAITVWPSDSMTAGAPSERCVNLRGDDDLASDIETALAARDEKLASGVRALLMVDVPTANQFDEVHARLFQQDPLKLALQNLDTSELWKVRARVQLAFLVFVFALTAVAVSVFGPNKIVLLAGGVAAIYVLVSIGRTWLKRNEPFNPFEGMSPEEIEQLILGNPEDD